MTSPLKPEQRCALERMVADLIKDHTGIAYALRPDGLADPDTLHLYAEGAAHVIVYKLLGPEPPK
jgi:hypothetical protein